MRFGFFATLGAAFMLVACVPQQPPVQEQKIFGRSDCRRMADNPALQQEFEVAKQVCVPRAEAAAVAGTTAMPLRSGLGGAIVDGIEQGMARNQIAMSTVMSCMAERGYLFRTRADHEAVCAAIATQNAPAKGKISAPAKPKP